MIRTFNENSVKPIPRLSLNEALVGVFHIFEKYFPASLIYSTDLKFEYDTRNIFTIFDVLNSHFFGNQLTRIQFSMCGKSDFAEIIKMFNMDSSVEYYAAYIPQYVNVKNEIVKESIFLIDGYGKMTFKFAVSCIMHEMIHYYDMHNGALKTRMRSGNFRKGEEHYTPDFINFSQMACQEGLQIMVNGQGINFDELNKSVAEYKQLTEEESLSGWRKFVKRLEAGERIPNCGIAPNGNIVFVIP